LFFFRIEIHEQYTSKNKYSRTTLNNTRNQYFTAVIIRAKKDNYKSIIEKGE